MTQGVQNYSHQFRLKDGTEVLFAGDSHIVGSLVDTLFPNSKNIGLQSESYFHTYYKLIYFTNKYKIKKIILGFSYHNLGSYYDLFINGYFSSLISSRTFFIFPLEEKIRVIKWNKSKLYHFFKEINISALNLYTNSHDSLYNFVDGFHIHHYRTRFDQKISNQRIKTQFYNENKVGEFADLNILFLKKIIELCNKRKIELHLLITPLHPNYLKKVPKKFVTKLHTFKNEYYTTHINRKINLIDLGEINLSDSCYSPDGDHISKKGVEKFNIKLKQELKKMSKNAEINF